MIPVPEYLNEQGDGIVDLSGLDLTITQKLVLRLLSLYQLSSCPNAFIGHPAKALEAMEGVQIALAPNRYSGGAKKNESNL
jgi:hypothetical protein